MAEFPPIKNALSREDRPLVITDADGRLLVWYLPGLLSPERQVCPRWFPLSAFELTVQCSRSLCGIHWK